MALFDVPGEAYGRFMGRFSEPLADETVGLLGLVAGWRALDVGCGPGALTSRLVDRLGASEVTAVDPSPPFVSALHERLPGVDVSTSSAESLPFEDASFDVVTAQLVVHFMADPVAGLVEMSRVCRPGGVVAASVWDHAGGRGPLSPFWAAVATIDPSGAGESTSPGSRAGHLAELFAAAALRRIVGGTLTVTVRFATFEQWWEPYTLGVGPAGAYLGRCDEATRSRVRAACRDRLPNAPFELSAVAWSVVASPGPARR